MPILDRSTPGVRLRLIPFTGAEDEAIPIDLGDRLLTFEYTDSERGHDKVKLSLRNNDLAFFEDENGLLGGARIEVSWGYAELMSRPRKVILEKVKGFTTLQIEGYDGGVLMDRQQRCDSYDNMTRSEVAAAVATRNGFSAARQTIEETSERFEVISQSAETDVQLLRRLADREGFEWWIDTVGFHFRERDQAQAPVRRLTWYPDGRGNIINLNMESDLTRRVSAVRSKSIDPETGEENEFVADTDSVERDTLSEASQSAKSPGIVRRIIDQETNEDLGYFLIKDDGSKTSLSDDDALVLMRTISETDTSVLERNASASVNAEGLATSTENSSLAAARYRRAERKSIRLKGDTIGDPELEAKTVIDIQGIGSWLSGLYYIETAKHRIKAGSYRVELTLDADGVQKVQGGSTPHGEGSDQNEQTTDEEGDAPTGDESPPELKRFRMIDQETNEAYYDWKEVD